MDVDTPQIEQDLSQRFLGAYGITPAANGTATVHAGGKNYILSQQLNDRSEREYTLKTPEQLLEIMNKAANRPDVRESPILMDEVALMRPFREVVERGKNAIAENPPTYDMDKAPGDIPADVKAAIEKAMQPEDVQPRPAMQPALVMAGTSLFMPQP